MFKNLFLNEHSKYVDKIHLTYEDEYNYFKRYEEFIKKITRKRYAFVNDDRVRIPLVGQYIMINSDINEIRKVVFVDEKDNIFEDDKGSIYTICKLDDQYKWYDFSVTDIDLHESDEQICGKYIYADIVEDVKIPYNGIERPYIGMLVLVNIKTIDEFENIAYANIIYKIKSIEIENNNILNLHGRRVIYHSKKLYSGEPSRNTTYNDKNVKIIGFYNEYDNLEYNIPINMNIKIIDSVHYLILDENVPTVTISQQNKIFMGSVGRAYLSHRNFKYFMMGKMIYI